MSAAVDAPVAAVWRRSRWPRGTLLASGAAAAGGYYLRGGIGIDRPGEAVLTDRATECQAMDRARRIGQDKPVFVHRPIAENTVEAAIQRMQARKQALADAQFEGTGRGPPGLTDEDIDVLFGPARSGSRAGP